MSCLGLWRDLNIALRRLKCLDRDEFRGILPSTEGPDFNPIPPVFACTFCSTPKFEHLLALANEDGKIAIQNSNLQSDHNPFEGYQAHHNAIFDIAWAPREMRLTSVSGDHTAVLWDVQQSGELQEISRFHAHTRSVKTVTFPKEDKMIFATGARDGVIMLWDTRVQRTQLTVVRPDNFILNSHCVPGTPVASSGSRSRRVKPSPSRASSITSLVFQDNHTLISCGAGDGKVKVWDIRKSYSTLRREPQPKFCMSTPNGSGRSGFTCLALDSAGYKLYASCMDNTIYCYNIATYEEKPVGAYKGAQIGTFFVRSCLSSDGRYLLSGSTDENAYIWDTHSTRGDVHLPIVKLVGHKAEVTCVAWSPVGEVKIVTCSDDARHCLWRVGQEFRGDNHQVELHGWAEEVSDRPAKAFPSTPVTPATPSFTSWRRWTPCLQRTPDNPVGEPSSECDVCHQLSTPCLRCIATRAPLPVSMPHGSKKRLEVLWEEDADCPECEKENRAVLNQVTNNVDALPRRLFTPTKRPASDGAGTARSPKKRSTDECRSPIKRPVPSDLAAEPSPKKPCISQQADTVRRTSPRKRCLPSPTDTPEKRCRVEQNASCSMEKAATCENKRVSPPSGSAEGSFCSPRKMRKTMPQEVENALPESGSPSKKVRKTPIKRRISDRPTDSPHKRLAPNDDLLGIASIEESLPSSSVSHNRPKKLCARHSRLGFNSPTLNLPNYVVDGTSPHHRCSPVHHKDSGVDWLTRMSRERKGVESENTSEQDPCSLPAAAGKTPSQKGLGNPTPAKTSSDRAASAKNSRRKTPAKNSSSRITPAKLTATQAAPTTPNQSSKKTPSRRPSNSEASSSGSNSNRVATSLLRFFPVSQKPKEQQCSIIDTPSRSVSSGLI